MNDGNIIRVHLLKGWLKLNLGLNLKIKRLIAQPIIQNLESHADHSANLNDPSGADGIIKISDAFFLNVW